MNSHKCDMCGLYLIPDGQACQECVKPVKKSSYLYQENEDLDKEEPEYEYYLRDNR